MSGFSLRPGMLLGVSGAAVQQDGGTGADTWSWWYENGYIKDGADPKDAAFHVRHWHADVMLMRRMNVQICQLGVDWARIEPREGEFDAEAMNRFKEEILLLRGVGIKPLVTLHHFSEPLWFMEKGGWERYDNVRHFLLFVRYVVTAIGHLAEEYVSLTEPNTHTVNGYLTGSWPPGKKSLKLAQTVLSVMTAAHIRAYKLIHETRRAMGFFENTRVGMSIQMRSPDGRARIGRALISSVLSGGKTMHSLLTEAVTLGKFSHPLKNYGRARPGRYCDFHAIVYRGPGPVPEDTAENIPVNHLGWEIDPEGIGLCAKYADSLASLPIYIIDAGCCDNDDSFRAKYLADHLAVLSAASLPIERYYYWSFLDGFELCDGESARFGLVHTDFGTGERRVKDSGEFYAQIIRNRAVSQGLFDQFVSEKSYPQSK